MNNKEIYLCRHGETAWTLSGQHTGSTDIPLTDVGKEQAKKIGKRLQKIEFSDVFSSPLQRAQETCHLAGFDKKMTLAPELCEWNYGDFEGLSHDDIIRQTPTWDLFAEGAPNGETPTAIAARADAFIVKLLKLPGPIALFSHGHFLRVLCARWLGLPVQVGRRLLLSVASISILGYEREARALKLWNDTSHL